MNNSCVREDVEYNHKLFRHIDDRLLSNKVFAMNLIKKIPYSCNLVSSALMHDRQFALEAVRHDGSNLYYASEGLKNDREVVLAAVMSGKNAEAALWAANDIFKNENFTTLLKHGLGFGSYAKKNNKNLFHVVAIDYGIKKNILRYFSDFNCKVTVVSCKTSAFLNLLMPSCLNE